MNAVFAVNKNIKDNLANSFLSKGKISTPFMFTFLVRVSSSKLEIKKSTDVTVGI